MGYSGIVTIFSEPPQPSLRPWLFVVSVLVHGGAFGLFTIQMLEKPRIVERFPQNHFAVRVLDFHSSESRPRQAAGGESAFPGPSARGAADPVAGRVTTGASQSSPDRTGSEQASGSLGSAGSPAVARLTPQRTLAPQTVLQPDVPQPVILPQTAIVPLVVLWAPEKVAPRKIVLPAPDTSAIAMVRPSLDTPIKEENLSDLKLASSAFVTQSLVVQPSTTSPVVVRGSEETKKVPQTTSKQSDPPTPSRVLSLSDTRITEGQVTIPVANQTAKASTGTGISGQLKTTGLAGSGTSASKVGDKGEGKGGAGQTIAQAGTQAVAQAGTQTGARESNTLIASSAGPQQGSAKQSDGSGHGGQNSGVGSTGSSGPNRGSGINPQGGAGASSSGAGTGANTGVGESSSTVHISLPKDGQFGVVVFGSSIAERYPETAEMWSGRMASTVYLRVGQSKSWILQYALSRLQDAGNGHVEAPWPFEIARPNIDPADMDTDAVILHGFVNQDGRFEKLQVVFPNPLMQAPMIQNTLNQWQFRPAKQNGKPVPVEILLIIPDQSQ